MVSFLLVAGTAAVFLAVYLFNYFRFNLTQASSGAFLGSGSLDVAHDFNLLLFKVDSFNNPTSSISALGVFNFQVEKGKLTILQISPLEEIKNIWGSGKIPVSSLYGLSSLSQTKGRGSFSMENVLAMQLGVPIDGIIYTDDAGFEKISTVFNIGPEYFSKSHNIFGNGINITRAVAMLGSTIKTNLDLKSIVSLSNYLVLNFPQSFESVPLRMIDENAGKYDILFRDKLSNQKIVEERQSIIVLNATTTPGLALNMGRLVSNLGLSLLSTGNNLLAEQHVSSSLITKNPHSYSTERVAHIFGIEDVRSADLVSDDPKFSRLLRADLVLIAGSDQSVSK